MNESIQDTTYRNVAVIGAQGAIGSALIDRLITYKKANKIYDFSQKGNNSNLPEVCSYTISYDDEISVEQSSRLLPSDVKFDLILVTIGVLHNNILMPEKKLSDCSLEKFQYIFMANAFIPALIIKYFLPKISSDRPGKLAVLSARLGSISDNQLGGWYAYRSSKAALNMIIKNIAIESSRNNKKTIIVGLHPGTTDSYLSKPFQVNVPKKNLFTPRFASDKILNVVDCLEFNDSGKCLAWDGQKIPP